MATPTTTIDALPAAASVNGSQLLVVQEVGVTKHASVDALASYVGGHITIPMTAAQISALANPNIAGVDVQAQLTDLIGRVAALSGAVFDTVWTGTDPPPDQSIELWWDTDEPVPPLDSLHVGIDAPTNPALELWWDSDEPSVPVTGGPGVGVLKVQTAPGVWTTIAGGVATYASDAEVVAGVETSKAVSPATLKASQLYFTAPGAVGDNSTDCTAAIQAAIDAAAAKGGGTVVLPAGLFKITDTLVMKTNVSLRGEWPSYATLTTDQRGTWLVWAGANNKTMLQVGHKDQTVDVHSVNIEQIGLDGVSNATVTGFSIGSNTRTSALYITTSINVRRCHVAKLGVGLQWGTGETQEQSDFLYFEQVDFTHCVTAGVRVNGTNCGDLSTLDTVRFSDCSQPGEPYIDLLMAGAITFRNCAGGGDGTNTRGFVRRSGLCNKITLINCQCEKMRYFLRTEGATDHLNPVELDSCWLDDGVEIAGGQIIVSKNTKIRDLIQFTGTAGRWFGFGDILGASQGSRVVDSGASNIFYNLRIFPPSIYTVYAAGEEITMAAPALMSSPNRQFCVRGGRLAPTWVATTAYTGTSEPSWKPSTAYNVGDYITPSYGNARKYRCTTAGTSGATEPNFKLYGTTPSDGTSAWAASEATTTPTYVLPKVDNGHVYKLNTAGTSAGTEPTWPLTTGTTVTDGTCVWQETGPAALIRQSAVLAQDGGGAPPTSGFYERGAVRWNNGMDAGEGQGWVCVLGGNPGTWAPMAPTLRVLSRVATPIAQAANDLVLLSNLTVAGPVTVNLAAAPVAGQIYTIKDGKGDAATNNITIVPAAGTIDGAANKVINTNFGSMQLVYTGTTWCVV